MGLGELFVSLGIKVDEGKIKSFESSIKTLRNGLVTAAASFTGAIYALDKFVSGTVNSVASLENLNAQTGISIDKLQKWDRAGQLTNLSLSAGQAASSVANLEKHLTAIRMGEGNIKPFSMLGINIDSKDALQVLEDIRGSAQFKGMAPAMQTNILQQIGIDPAMISTLRLTKEEFDKLGNGFLGKSGRLSVMQTGVNIRQLKMQLEDLKNLVVSQLAPALNKMIGEFFAWFQKNGSKLAASLKTVFTTFIDFVQGIARGVGLVAEFAQSLFGAEKGIKILTLALGAAALSLVPLLLPLTALFLLLEDIAVWKAGGVSAFGDFYKSIEEFYNKLKPIIGKMMSNLKPLFNVVGDIKKSFGEISISSGFEKLLDLLLRYLDLIAESPKTAGLGAAIGFATSGPLGALIGAGLGGAAGVGADFIGSQLKAYEATERFEKQRKERKDISELTTPLKNTANAVNNTFHNIFNGYSGKEADQTIGQLDQAILLNNPYRLTK